MNKKTIILAGILALGAIAAAVVLQRRAGAPHEAAHAELYQCPMHPAVTADKPGNCPICGMNLVRVEPEEGAAAPAAAATGKSICVLHKCTMANCKMELPLKPGETVTCPVCGTHTAPAEGATGKLLYYRNPMDPAVTSPVPMKDPMGMDYIPVYEESAAAGVAGQASTVVSEQKRRLIGMKTEPVAKRRLVTTVRASGKVAYDPELYNAIAEHHSAVMAREKVKDSPWPDARERADALVAAAALRLRQLGITEEQIASYSGTEPLPENLLVGGSGASVWVYAQIYEYEIAKVRPGQEAEITTPAYPGAIFRGKVRSIDPNLSPETRSLRARIEVPNPGGRLKLEMFVNAAIKTDLGLRLALPEGALLDSGARKLVFVDLGGGRLEPREVRVGQEADGYHELLSGVKEGETVVTSANFLIDSESKLKALR